MSAALAPFACRVCGAAFILDTRPLSCPRCCADNAIQEVPESDDNPVLGSNRKTDKGQKNVIAGIGNLVLEPWVPYPSQVPAFDRVVGGLAKGFTVFIAGPKGVGKSTLVTTIGAKHCLKFDKKGRPSVDPTRKVFLASAEEPVQRFLGRCERLGFLVTDAKGVVQTTTATAPYVQIFKTQFFASRETQMDRLIQQIRKHKPTLVIFDSIVKFRHPEVKGVNPMTHGPRVVDDIVWLSEELGCCCLIIARLTKGGKMAGSEDIGYDSDCVMFLRRHKPKKISKNASLKGTKSRYVRVSVEKNRMGPDTIVGWFRMGNRGLESVSGPGKTKKKPVPKPHKVIRRSKKP